MITLVSVRIKKLKEMGVRQRDHQGTTAISRKKDGALDAGGSTEYGFRY